MWRRRNDVATKDDVRDGPVADDRIERVGRARTVERRRSSLWSPAQLVAAVMGIASLVAGVIGLTNTGIHTDALPGPADTTFGFTHTQFLALVALVFGVLMLAAAMTPVAGRAWMGMLSICVLGLGIVVAAGWWTVRFEHWLGTSSADGWLFIVIGTVGLAAAVLLPTLGARRTIVRERERTIPARTTRRSRGLWHRRTA